MIDSVKSGRQIQQNEYFLLCILNLINATLAFSYKLCSKTLKNVHALWNLHH